MKLNPNRYGTVYEELSSFYPDYYRNVREMQAILSADGALCDGIVDEIDLILDNSFILTANEATIQRLEMFLGIIPLSNDLEERREYVLSFFVGFGQCSAKKLKALIKLFTLDSCEISFSSKDNNGNYILNITIQKKNGINPDWNTLFEILDDRIPAHLNTYRLIVYQTITPQLFAATVNLLESYSFTVPTDTDLLRKKYLTMPNGALLRLHNGALLYYETEAEE